MLFGTEPANAQSRDLQFETAPVVHHAPRTDRPRPVAAPEIAGPVHVGLVPIGPSVLRIGSLIRFKAWSNRTGFGHAYLATASGKVILVAENLPIRANRRIILPRPGLALRAVAPAGDDTLIFVSTRQRFAGFAGGAATNSPIDIQLTAEGLVSELKSRLSGAPSDDWGFTTVVVRVTE
jgi:hypothetical protein